MSRESDDGTHRSWHRHFHPLGPQEEAHNRLAPMLRRPPQSPRLPHSTQTNPFHYPTIIEPPSDPPRTFTRYPSRQVTIRRQEDYETGEDSGMEQGSRNGQDEVIDLIDLTGDEPEEPPRQAQSSVPNLRTSQLPRPFRYVNGPVSTDEIVDLVDEPDEPVEVADGPPSSPEVQFLSSSRRPHATPHPYLDRNRRDHDRNIRTNEPFMQSIADMRTRGLWANRSLPVPHEPPLNSHLPPAGISMLDRISMSSRSRFRSRNDDWDSENDDGGYDGFDEAFDPDGFSPRDLERWRRHRGLVNLTIDYGLAAFPIGSTPVTVNQESARPAYKPPSPAPEGFARTLADEDVAICPNCACELGVGEGKKQEIWVAKPCGHVRTLVVFFFFFYFLVAGPTDIFSYRYTVGNAQRIGLNPRPRRRMGLKKQNRLPNARFLIAVSKSVRRQPCFICTCDPMGDL